MTANTDDIIVGIDLGTTFSLVAYADERGPHVIRDENGDARVPSVLGFSPDGKATVGWEARRHAVENAEHTVCSIKRLIGLGLEDIKKELPFLSYHVERGERDTVRIPINGRPLSPQEISSLILKELKVRAEQHLGRPVRKAVITVPAYFDDSQRQATRDAGQIAGLEVVRIVNEPTAAALAYGIGASGRVESEQAVPSNANPASGHSEHDALASATRHETKDRGNPRSLPIGEKSKCSSETLHPSAMSASEATRDNPHPAPLPKRERETVAIYDMGGGTFDVSILRVTNGAFEVLSTHGDTHLGGDDFDRTIITLVQKEVAEQFGRQIDSPRTRQALRLLAEEVKIKLSKDESATVELDLGLGKTYRRTITRKEFEAMITPLIERSVIACCRAMADANLQTDAIDQVILVGGSSRIPLIRRRVEQIFGRPPYTALNPDEVVALGAAVQAQILAGHRTDALLLDVTPLSLGIETMGGAMGKLIMRNTRIPCQATEMFTTFVDGQTNVKINVLQGERELAKDCRSLAEFDLRGIPPMPAGIPKIDVRFLIDANGILRVTAKEQRSGQEASVQVIPSHGLTRDEVRRMERESIDHAREDMTAHRLIDLRNQVEYDTHKTEQTLAKYGDRLSLSERAKLEESMRRLRQMAAETTDCEALHQALDKFGKQTLDLANLAVTEALKS